MSVVIYWSVGYNMRVQVLYFNTFIDLSVCSQFYETFNVNSKCMVPSGSVEQGFAVLCGYLMFFRQ